MSDNSTVVLLGPPNTGKSTLFNHLTGKKVKTVNYPGSTVELSFGESKGNQSITFVDTPGLHSLNPHYYPLIQWPYPLTQSILLLSK